MGSCGAPHKLKKTKQFLSRYLANISSPEKLTQLNMVESDLVQLSISSVISLPNRFLLCYTFNPIHPSVYTDSSGIVRIYRLEINGNQGHFQFVVLCSPEYTSPAVVILPVYPSPREKCAYLQHLRTARVDGKASVYRGAKDGFYYHDQY